VIPGNDGSNWFTSETENTMAARIKIVKCDMPELTVLQIHEQGWTNKPLWRMSFYPDSGKINSCLLNSDGTTYTAVLLNQVDYDFFDAKCEVKANILKIYVNNVLKLTYDISYWSAHENYFKAGVYPQGVGEGLAYFDTLTWTHTQ